MAPFLNPWQLWLGLGIAGVAVPIIIHLLYRKHRKQTDWAAMELLRRAMVIRSGQVKLEDYLILFLRCLALALIAWALVRPILNKDTANWAGQQRVGMVVAIDASYSMNHGEFSRFERAKAKANEILATAAEGDSVSVMLMSNRPEILLRATSYEPTRFADVLDAHKDPTPYRLSLERNIDRLEELVAELKAPARECFLITDAQELDWAELSPKGRESLERLASKPNVKVFVVPVETDGDDNLSITRLAYASGSLRRSEAARFVADVANQGRHPANGGTVEFFANDKLIARRAIGQVEPGKATPVTFVHSFENEGDVQLAVRLSKDELATDNDRFAVVNVRSKINILCVDGDTTIGEDAARRGVAYAVHAFRLRMRGADSPVQVTQIEAADLGQETLADFDIIFLANVPDVSPEMAERLERFTHRGGGLIFFLGDRVEPDIYNKRLGALLPAELIETIEAEPGEVGWAIGPIMSEHPLAVIVKELERELVDAARFAKVMKARPAPGGQTILSIVEQGAPLLLSRIVGDGTVLLFTTSADRAWNNLPVHPLYTMLLQQAATNL
ncbi:MAG: BatA domain-containing protein, partial [Phycisphaerae bacterium]|nr:BatA domain-containing protein [Phycisphaerae bacterium]